MTLGNQERSHVDSNQLHLLYSSSVTQSPVATTKDFSQFSQFVDHLSTITLSWANLQRSEQKTRKKLITISHPVVPPSYFLYTSAPLVISCSITRLQRCYYTLGNYFYINFLSSARAVPVYKILSDKWFGWLPVSSPFVSKWHWMEWEGDRIGRQCE